MEKQKNSLEKKSLFEFFGIDAKDKDNNKVQEEKSDEHYIKIAEEYSKDLEERIIKEPKKFRSYKNRIDAVENALFKNSLCKVFCLIADGVNYNDLWQY